MIENIFNNLKNEKKNVVTNILLKKKTEASIRKRSRYSL